MQVFADTFALAPDAQAIYTRLLWSQPEFEHARLARLVCLFSERQLFLHGAPCEAIIAEPRVQGVNRWLFDFLVADLCRPILEGEDPEFLVYIDRALWSGESPIRQERLIYHELCHLAPRLDEDGLPRIGDDGRVKLKLVPHDIERFHSEIRRYGVEVTQIEETCLAIADSQATTGPARRQRA